jgi:hypothetical protein
MHEGDQGEACYEPSQQAGGADHRRGENLGWRHPAQPGNRILHTPIQQASEDPTDHIRDESAEDHPDHLVSLDGRRLTYSVAYLETGDCTGQDKQQPETFDKYHLSSQPHSW